jgi:hypothetical protein
MSWRDISLTCPCYQTHDGATILSGVAFTRGPRRRVVELLRYARMAALGQILPKPG